MVGTEQSLKLTSPPGGRIMRAGRVVACPIDESCLLIVGAGGSMAGQLTAELNDDPAASLTASVIGWPLATPAASASHGFAALLTLDGTERPLTTVRFGQEGTGRRYVFTPRPISVSDVAAIVAEAAGPQLSDILDSLLDLMMKGPVGRRRLSAMITLLKAAHRGDGFIELLGESEDGAIFLKGWGRDIAAGVCRAVVSGEKPMATDCGIATFPRQDVPDGAGGFVGLLPANETLRARDIEGLVYRGRGAWRYAAVHERRLIAGPAETPGHMRAVLLQTHSSPQVLLRLRAAANSFDGRETISTLPLPVRLGIDTLFQENGGGFLMTGWMLDADGHVQSVKLRRGRAEARLDDCWTRLDRSDVTDAFTDEPMFKSALEGDSHSHGFIVYANSLGGDAAAPLHLELTLKDSRRAFMPLTPARVPARMAALRQIRSIDPADWALSDLIDRQIVPFLSASESPSPTVGAIVDAGGFNEAVGPPIVIAAGEAEDADIAPFLGLLALDPETQRAPIALVVPAERFRRQAARIRQVAQFYRLPLRLISAEKAGDIYDLLEVGVRALASETVVLLAGSLLPHRTGWYGKLAAAHEALKGSIISPTLAYEDHSVRWAGSWSDGHSEDPLFGRYAGYPLSAVTGLKTTRVAAASLECCIAPREALLRAGGFSASYLGSQQKGMDLGLRLSRAGIESYWLPSVQMLGSDEVAGVGEAAMAVLIERIDQAIFRARWAPALMGEELPTERVSA
ncbi:hypothetical protein ILFOPFJJ_06207 [Ensifer psoraleae]|uniref:hypothetical protein n=1 Tax=Sinorhizobium psoraleae TaxID=520838 RepID=UPI0015680C7B|nr:hypothetical protein [Sinorhizobium psoraleae]NRP75284.1 hypothetical protein [Sinorhizobium psoraleae]